MPADAPRILALNPGSTSTAIALFAGPTQLFAEKLRHPDEGMAAFSGRPMLAQLDFRMAALEEALERHDVDARSLDAAVGRGGLLRPLPGGTYRVNAAMLEDLAAARRGDHASNLGAFMASRVAERAGCEAFIVDPVSVDEWPPVARISGLDGLERQCLSHALNTKAVAKRFAASQGRKYEELRLIVAHLGSGTSISAHEGGRMVEVSNPREEGPFSVERAGSLPVMVLVDWCLSCGLSRADIERRLFREGGLFSYLGTRDLAEAERRAREGDERAALVLGAMHYQIAKEIGAMAAVLAGRVDAILLTGGMAHSLDLVDAVRARVGWIAPVHVYPGEDELRALAEGALRVLRGEEPARDYGT